MSEQQPPLLRIVKGDPTSEELAALVAVVAAISSASSGDTRKPRSEWAAAHHKVRGAHRHGPGSWRFSAR